MRKAAAIILIIFGLLFICGGAEIAWNSKLGSQERNNGGAMAISGALFCAVGIFGVTYKKNEDSPRFPHP